MTSRVLLLALFCLVCASYVQSAPTSFSRFRQRLRDPAVEAAQSKVTSTQQSLNQEVTKRIHSVKALWQARDKKDKAGVAKNSAEAAALEKSVQKKQVALAKAQDDLAKAKKKAVDSAGDIYSKCKTTCVRGGHASRVGKVFGKDKCGSDPTPATCFNTDSSVKGSCEECFCPELSLVEAASGVKLNFLKLPICSALALTFEDGKSIGFHFAVDVNDASQPWTDGKAALVGKCKTMGKIKAYGMAGNVGYDWRWMDSKLISTTNYIMDMMQSPAWRDKPEGEKNAKVMEVLGAPAPSDVDIAKSVRDSLREAGCTFTSNTLAPVNSPGQVTDSNLVWTGTAWTKPTPFEERNTNWAYKGYANVCADTSAC